mmetsp:Transcript_95199/g.142638  ORF Transcript_95199/g.142638 Transcript_95199/m.142638 type:complete len:242 (-) Transcript_95199:75-800(-)|eukprot:CAMPEP_0116998976 /NCGR_PEP_ID=MMETSP0472-20121206/1864_1 /TAXON_ID=693140 ORGANISM="Tiarina fusus, Strain LIS" /NCGR_SAMPLE_ID=MMETSP0472 /ASSEMBLY_ACC=CAM_ASM_000603 /LENGTH=241 /DNA_ID=CAMNT_0004698299 /DNA_START=102 /DNA_END=827 /DNA_ORIENTATION=-
MTLPTPKDFVCPLTKVLMKDPVEAPHGLSYERRAIVEWLGKHECCPVVGFPLEASELRTNTKLQWKIRYWASSHEAQADAKEEERRPLDKFVCPLTDSIMIDPVTTREGHNYEREALQDFVARHGSISPFSGKPLGEPEFYVNKKLAWEIRNWQSERPELAMEPSKVDVQESSSVQEATKEEARTDSAPKMHTITIPGSKMSAQYPSQRSSMMPSSMMTDAGSDKDVLSILEEVCQLELSV